MKHVRPPLLLIAGVALSLGAPARAQISLEAPPRERTLPVREQVEREMASARIRLGPIRLLPFLRLYNVGWTNNALVSSEGEVDDLTASVSAGARVVVPFGRNFFLRGLAEPSYDWYQKTTELRGFGGSYGGELLGLFNRLTVGAGGGYDRSISTVSSEVARDVLNTTTSAQVKAEVEVLKRLSLFGGFQEARYRLEDPFAQTPGLETVTNLDRTESAYRAGIRYAYSSTFSLGLMAENVQTRFVTDPELQDNDVSGLLLVVRYDREKLYVEGTFGVREGEPVNAGSYYPEFRTGTYGYFASYQLARPLEIQARGSRRPVASLFLDNPYYFETQNGASLRYRLGRQVALHANASLGSNRYVNPVYVSATGEIVTRIDDVSRVAGGLDYALSRTIKLGIELSQEKFDSNIDFYDRSVFRITGGVTISAVFAAEERR